MLRKISRASIVPEIVALGGRARRLAQPH